jgi:hypothetical protein
LVHTMTPTMSMHVMGELMEHMTPEELSAVWERFVPPGPSGN